MIHTQEHGDETTHVSIDQAIIRDSMLPYPSKEYETVGQAVGLFLP